MRFALYISVLIALIPLCLVRPFFGLCLYYVVSLMQPKYLCWRPDLQDAILVGVPMVVGAIAFGVRRRTPVPKRSPVTGRLIGVEHRLARNALVEPSLLLVVLAALLAYVALTRYLVELPASLSSESFNRLLKMSLVLVLVTGLASDVRRLKLLYAVVALSVAFWAIKGGIRVLMLGPHQTYGYNYDNNFFALTSVMALPMVFYFGLSLPKSRMRILFLAFSGLICLAIICSQSRAGFLAMTVVLFCFAWTSRHRFKAVAGLTILVAAALAASGAEIQRRVDSIIHYQSDLSARSRFATWESALTVLSEHPLIGCGFSNFERAVHKITGGRKAAHNIWLSNLAELGVIGYPIWLAFFIGGSGLAWMLMRFGRRCPPELRWSYYLARGLFLALVAYAIHGLFHNEEYLDLSFAITGLIIALKVTVNREIRQRKLEAALEGPVAALTPLATSSRFSKPTMDLTPRKTLHSLVTH